MEMQVFDNQEFGSVRTCTENDGGVLFCATDVARALGYARPADAITAHCKGSVIHRPLETAGGTQQAKFITEPDVMRLIVSSKLPAAQKFEAWVFEEVLPAIRKHGMYATPATVEAMLADPDTMIKTLQALKDERAARIEAERTRDRLLHSSKTYTTTEIAKELGMRSAQQLNRELEARHVQFRQNGTWLLYSKYADRGLTSVKQTVLDTGRIIYDRRWTGDGRDFLLQLFA